MFGAGIPIDGPQAQPGRRGLLFSAVPVGGDGETAGRQAVTVEEGAAPQPAWAAGFVLDPDVCGAVDPAIIECEFGADKGTLANPDLPPYQPFLTFGVDVCSTLAGNRDRDGRSRRNLAATESWQIEREFFDGVASKATTPDTDNPYLTNGDASDVTGGGGALAPVASLARIEASLASCLHGQRGMIHATPELVTFWANGGALRLEGQTLLTVMDTIVVAGSGYSGNDPDGGAPTAGTSWAYGTGLVYIRQGVVWSPNAMDPGSAVDRQQNTITWRVERPNAVYRSPCCLLAVHSSLS